MSKTSDFEVGSVEWIEYVKSIKFTNVKDYQKELLGALDDSEMIENYPSTDGLYRLYCLLYGQPQIFVDVVKSPSSDDRAATVKVEIIGNEGMCVCSSADVYPGNTKHPFSSHPVATAETKALGRTLKRALGLRIHTHEEMLGEDAPRFKSVEPQQVRAIENMSKKLNVNLHKLLAEVCGVTVDALQADNSPVSQEQGIEILEKLSDMRNKGVPEEYQVIPI